MGFWEDRNKNSIEKQKKIRNKEVKESLERQSELKYLDLDYTKIPEDVNAILNDGKENVKLPELGKTFKRKWIDGKEHIFKCFYYSHHIHAKFDYFFPLKEQGYRVYDAAKYSWRLWKKRIYSDKELFESDKNKLDVSTVKLNPIYIVADSKEEPFIYDVICDLKNRKVI